MPLYDYRCSDCQHGFSEMKAMERYREPAPCPLCHAMADRVIAAPRLSTMRSEIRRAHQVNEHSAHEPRVTEGHRCTSGCDHRRERKAALKSANGAKRPWMLGH